jgi:phenylalanyl-tRNA synthetase alpha chain
MSDRFEEIRAHAVREIEAAADERGLRDVEVRYLGKKGTVSGLMAQMKEVPPADRPEFGKQVNALKQSLQALVDEKSERLKRSALMAEIADPFYDPTLPGVVERNGSFHPLTLVSQEVEEIFRSMGFIIPDYPEAESEFFNFEALNIPADHPARDMQDTFWLTDGNLLRTHTSPGQVRAMREFPPPFRAIFPGKVYRYEAVDASHEHTFHQIEGLLIDREVSVANLIHSMKVLINEIFKREVKIRLRPGYFPFVEPGFELDMECSVCGGRGCSVCKQSGWVELLPCGLVHPNVIRFGGLDPAQWSGWAFGLGLSRLVMMKYQIDDIRHLMGGDLRFLAQFRQI